MVSTAKFKDLVATTISVVDADKVIDLKLSFPQT